MVCDPEKLLNIRNNILVLIHAKYCPKDPSECNQVVFKDFHGPLETEVGLPA